MTPALIGAPEAVRADLGAIFVSLELSRATLLVTSLSPGGAERVPSSRQWHFTMTGFMTSPQQPWPQW
jgi:hypothetical protein